MNTNELVKKIQTDKKEREQALKTLIDLGVIIPFSEQELYHGRAGKIGEQWKVIPDFDNANNNTGNRNINKIPVLHTGAKDIANDFAEARTRKYGGQHISQVHKIKTYKDGYYILMPYAYDVNRYDTVQKQAYIESIIKLLPTNIWQTFELNPPRFEEKSTLSKKDLNTIIEMIENKKTLRLDMGDISDIVKDAQAHGINNADQTIRSLCVSWNSYAYTIHSLDNIHHILTQTGIVQVDGIPIDASFVKAAYQKIGIIGYRLPVRSATLGTVLDDYIIFDENHVNTQEEVDNEDIVKQKYLTTLTQYLTQQLPNTDIIKVLEYSTPQQTMQLLCSLSPEIAQLQKKDSCIWEGFLVGEHTETVLDEFEKCFPYEVTTELRPFIKIALFSHDIGKGLYRQAVREGKIPRNAETEKEANIKYAQLIYDKLGISEKGKDILSFIIGDSQSLTSQYYFKNHKKALEKLINECENILIDKEGNKHSRDVSIGLSYICNILQTCDSASYTRFAVTRDRETGQHYCNGSDTFTTSFKKPAGPYYDKLELKDPPTV